MFKIEKNVPLRVRMEAPRYPFKDMEVGDSFVADSQSVRSAAYQFGLRVGRKFTVRQEGDKWRIWRVV